MWSSTLSNCAQIGGKRKGKTHLLVRHHQVTKRRKRRKRRRRSRRRRLVWCSSGFLMPLACYFRTHPSGKKAKKKEKKLQKKEAKEAKKDRFDNKCCIESTSFWVKTSEHQLLTALRHQLQADSHPKRRCHEVQWEQGCLTGENAAGRGTQIQSLVASEQLNFWTVAFLEHMPRVTHATLDYFG